jgi:hypothetical protein
MGGERASGGSSAPVRFAGRKGARLRPVLGYIGPQDERSVCGSARQGRTKAR